MGDVCSKLDNSGLGHLGTATDEVQVSLEEVESSFAMVDDLTLKHHLMRALHSNLGLVVTPWLLPWNYLQ